MEGQVQKLLDAGWTEAEATRMMSYTEEQNPDLDEATALRLMRNLRTQVEARILSEQSVKQ